MNTDNVARILPAVVAVRRGLLALACGTALLLAGCSGATNVSTASTESNTSASLGGGSAPPPSGGSSSPPSATYVLTVVSYGSGTVSGSGVYCSSCSVSYDAGTVVTLTASPSVGYSFSGWSNSGCSGTGTCVVTMSAARTVSATFQPVSSSGSLELPVSGQATQLFRYPFLQVANSPQSVRIVWATASSGSSQIQYHLAGQPSTTTVSAAETFYSTATTGLSTAFFQQEALLTGLQPGAAYLYDVVHNGVALARNVPFTTFPEDSSAPVRFIAFGDSGTPYSQPRSVRDAIASQYANGDYVYPHDFIVGVGDMAYNFGSYADYNNNFFDQMSGRGDLGNGQRSILATRPFVPALGNHDYNQSYINTPSGFLASFVLPTAGVPSADAERYYSFDAGNAHFVVLDSMKFDTSGSSETANRLSDMLNWLDQDLAATTKTWRVVFFHHTIFSSAAHGTYGDLLTNRRMRTQLAPILQNHGVQLVMFGHDHLYQRSKRLRVDANGKIVRDAGCNVVDSTTGIVYVAGGNGGDDLHHRQADPTQGCGTAAYDFYVAQYGDGYDFVAMNNGVPALFDLYTTGDTPTTPTVRHGFTHVSIVGNEMTISAYNYQGTMMDQLTMSAN